MIQKGFALKAKESDSNPSLQGFLQSHSSQRWAATLNYAKCPITGSVA
jgi:hypothetical protein